MALAQYGTTLTFQGNTSLAALAAGNLVIYDDGMGTLYQDIGGVVTQLASTGFPASEIKVLADGSYLLDRQENPQQDIGGAHFEVLNSDGSVRVGDTDVASGTGHSLTGPSATATSDGGFVIAYTDDQASGTTHVTFPQGGTLFTGYDPNVSPDVGYRYYTPSAGSGATTSYTASDFSIANTGTFDNSGASGSDQAGAQDLEASLTLADGSIVTSYLNEVIYGKAGGGAQSANAVTFRILTPTTNSGPIQASQDPAPTDGGDNTLANVERGQGGQQLVSLGQSGFAVIWTAESFTSSDVQDGFNTDIRYFDQSGTALTNTIELFHRGTGTTNLPLNTSAAALGDGRIALVFEDGTEGANGTSATQLDVAVIPALGAVAPTITAITPAPTQGDTQKDFSLVSLGNGNIAVGYLDSTAGSLVKTYNVDGVVTPCYCTGTRILTAEGEVPVEQLAVGDLVITADGERRPVKWIGRRSLDLARHANPALVWPVRIEAGAFAPNLPARDLWISPGHAVFVDGILVPVKYLVNGANVVQVKAERVTYWHVELESHDVLLAEGLPAESYLDTGNRPAFENGGGILQLHPTFAGVSEGATCAPLHKKGPLVAAIRTRLLARARSAGHSTTSDAGLHVMADGIRIAPQRRDGGRYAFALPADARDIRLVSRTWVPAQQLPDSGDWRTLGVCVAALTIDDEPIGLHDLETGWHTLDRSGSRWTNGSGRLPAGARRIELELVGRRSYWDAAAGDIEERRTA